MKVPVLPTPALEYKGSFNNYFNVINFLLIKMYILRIHIDVKWAYLMIMIIFIHQIGHQYKKLNMYAILFRYFQLYNERQMHYLQHI